MPAVDQFGNIVAQSRAYRIGRIVSQIFHPTINGLLAYLLVGITGPGIASPRIGLMWTAICILLILIPPAAYFYVRLYRGQFSDDDVSHRSERTGLYSVAILTVVTSSIILYLVGIPRIFLRLNAAATGVTVICMLINFRWKISVHSASIGTLAMLATLLLGQGWGIFFWLCAAIVGWARIRTGNHTLLQVLAGWAVASIGVTIGLYL